MSTLVVQLPSIMCALFAAGATGLAGAASLFELRGRNRRGELPLVIAALVCAVASVVSLFFRFSRVERFFNAFGHLGSAITQSIIASLVLVVLLVALLVLLRQGRGIGRPLAVCTLAVGVAVAAVSARAVSITSGSANGSTASTVALGAYLLALAALLGMAGAWLYGGIRHDAGLVRLSARSVAGAAAVEALCCAAWLALRAASQSATLGSYVDPTQITTQRAQQTDALALVMGGELTLPFWGGAVVLGIAVPLVLGVVCGFAGRAAAGGARDKDGAQAAEDMQGAGDAQVAGGAQGEGAVHAASDAQSGGAGGSGASVEGAGRAGIAASLACLACGAGGAIAFQAVYVLSFALTKVSVFS